MGGHQTAKDLTAMWADTSGPGLGDCVGQLGRGGQQQPRLYKFLNQPNYLLYKSISLFKLLIVFQLVSAQEKKSEKTLQLYY
jgi:hypothetical protein